MDDLLDLNWSAPVNSKLATPNPPPIGQSGTSFDFLSQQKPKPKPQSGTGTPNYYSSTPSRAGTPSQPPVQISNARPAASTPQLPPGSGRNTPLQPPVPAGPPAGGLDAFSSLLSIPSSNAINGRNMTMAERQKAMEDEKRKKDEEDRKRFEAEGDFWDNLGGSGNAGSGSSGRPSNGIPKPPAQKNPANDLDDFLKPTPATSSRARSPIPSATTHNDMLAPSPVPAAASASSSAGNFWDKYDDSDNLLVSSQRPAAPSSSSRSPAPPVDPFDFDALAAAVPTQPQSRGQRNGSSMRTPVSDFDFGDREDREDDDDILGDLAKPVVPKPVETRNEAPRPTKQAPPPTSSPPPHIVGQIVEMGFSPVQARQALSKTESGLDVQAALEILLGSQGSGSGSSSRERERERERGRDDFPEDEDDDMVERERQRRREEEDRERRRRRRAGPSRDSVRARTVEQQVQDTDNLGSTSEQAEKYLAQASEIGTNMFNKATSFWNTSKEKALKVYEEQRKAMEANAAMKEGESTRKPVRDGRPKWMVDAEEGYPEDKRAAPGGFRDDHDEPAPAARIRQAREQNDAGSSRQNQDRATSSLSREQKPAEPSSGYRSAKERADLLFAEEEPKRYVSPARHPKKATASRPITPAAPLPSRQLVPATAQQLQSSAAHKAKGNEHFKLGRFAEAESAYTSAISSLPDKHLFLVPLHNNRAAARLKLGESGCAAADCTTVIELIGPSYHPSKEGPLPAEVASEVKLADGLIKAMTKRAQAWEMGEKWKNAVEDWEKLVGLDLSMMGAGAGATKTLAVEGARRSRKMLEDGNEPKPSSTGSANIASSSANSSRATPKPRARPATTTNVDKSAAVSELRKAAQAQEAEDEQRQALKDTVEAKLNAWKAGKETNLRALIASLDSVLWDEILKGGLKVGMHELIAEKQVKIKYMKVIARLHPDKISTTKTTVEQRMLANGAFGILNEAWQAFNK